MHVDYEATRRPLHPHNHPNARGIELHSHAGHQPWHWHVDDRPAGRTAREAGLTDDLPSYPERFPENLA